MVRRLAVATAAAGVTSIGEPESEMANFTDAGEVAFDDCCCLAGGELDWKIWELAKMAITSGASIGTLVWISRRKSSSWILHAELSKVEGVDHRMVS